MKALRMSPAALVAVGLIALAPSPSGADNSFVPVWQLPMDDAAPLTTASIIDRSLERGDLDAAHALVYKAYSLYAPELLPEEYSGSAIDKCGTHVAREIDEALPGLPEIVAAEIRGLRTRPTCDTYYDSAHFRVHYDTTGVHAALGWPDTAYRDAVVGAVESSWTQEVIGLAFRQPPSDGSDPDGGGGSALYDVYMQDCAGYYGYTQGCYTVPSTPRSDCTSFIVIDNDYAGFGYADPTDPMKVTVAHEFCHACQYSSNCWADTWYMECTSVWAEDYVYDSINDYRGYIPFYFNYPYASIEWQDGTGLRMYGSCVWNTFLSERFAVDIVPAIWSRLESTSNETSAFDYVLGLEGTNLEDAYAEYAVWNWFTNSRHDGTHYDEGAYWPLIAAERTFATYPVVAGAPVPAHRPDHLAWNYIHLSNPGGADGVLDIVYDGPNPASTANCSFVNTSTPGGADAELGEIPLDGLGQGSKGVPNWDDYSLAAVVVVNTSTSTNDMDYTIDADRSTPVAGSVYAVVTDLAAVTLRWTLASPQDVVSLDLLRAVSSDGDYEVLNDNPLEPVSPGVYVDDDVRPGEELRYQLVATLRDGSTDVVAPGVLSIRMDGSLGLALSPPSPNPFRDSTTLEFTVPGGGATVSVMVHDVSGRSVATLVDGWMGRGRHLATWDGTDGRGRPVAAGVYFCTLEVPGAVVARKMLLLR